MSNQGAPLPPEDGMQFIVPSGRTSGIALLAGYLGIASFIVCPLAPFALLCGFLALRDLKQNPQKTGKGRAITGIVCGSLMTVAILVWLVISYVGSKH